MKTYKFLFLILTGLVGCEWFSPPPVTEPAVEPEVTLTASAPEVQGDSSLVVISGSLGGSQVDLTWDFSLESSQDTTTKGSMFAQVGSSGGISLRFDNNFTNSLGDQPQGASDWLVRFTLGGLGLGDRYLNGKKTFAIPETAYVMITACKGPEDTAEVRWRHAEYNSTNPSPNLSSARIDQILYSKDQVTLRVNGVMKSTWGTQDYLDIGFNVLVGGPDDLGKNGSSLDYVFGGAQRTSKP